MTLVMYYFPRKKTVNLKKASSPNFGSYHLIKKKEGSDIKRKFWKSDIVDQKKFEKKKSEKYTQRGVVFTVKTENWGQKLELFERLNIITLKTEF